MPRPSVVRYLGLAGSVLLAVAAYRAGASSPWHPTITPRTILDGRDGVLTPVAWLVGILLLTGAWWAGRNCVPSARWAYVTAALWVVPLLPMLPLGSYDIYSYACQGWQQAHGLDPYAGGVDVLGCPWRAAVAPTWYESPAPYGPVFLVLAGLTTHTGSLAVTVAGLRILAVLGVLLTAACLPVLARTAGVDLGRAVWLALACPLVAVHLISGAHNDAVMIGLMVAGLALTAAGQKPAAPAAAGQKPAVLIAAGVLFGLAAGVKITAIVVIPFAVLLTGQRIRAALALGGGALIAMAGVSLAAGRGLGWVTNLSGSGVSIQWTSPPTAVGMTIDLITRTPDQGSVAITVTRALGVAVLAVVLIVLWWRNRNPLLGAGRALAATVALAPVVHPWYLTWPLTVLAATLARDTKWLIAPCAVASVLCLPDGYNLALAVKTQGAVAMTAGLVVLGVLAWRRRERT